VPPRPTGEAHALSASNAIGHPAIAHVDRFFHVNRRLPSGRNRSGRGHTGGKWLRAPRNSSIGARFGPFEGDRDSPWLEHNWAGQVLPHVATPIRPRQNGRPAAGCSRNRSSASGSSVPTQPPADVAQRTPRTVWLSRGKIPGRRSSDVRIRTSGGGIQLPSVLGVILIDQEVSGRVDDLNQVFCVCGQCCQLQKQPHGLYDDDDTPSPQRPASSRS